MRQSLAAYKAGCYLVYMHVTETERKYKYFSPFIKGDSSLLDSS